MQIKNLVWPMENRLLLFLCFCLLIPLNGFAQTKSIRGTVLDNLQEPVIGASVLEKGTSNGTITNFDGEFTLDVAENATLVISYIGYRTTEVSVSGRNIISVSLAENTELLDEVVVIGYGTVKKGDLTTAVSVISTDDLDLRPITSVSSAIQGKAAGVQVVQPSGQPGTGMVVRIRGASSISSSNDPLYVVDGVPVGEGEYAISFLSPNDIESMQILKDASSAAIYGSRAANGVVLITTKGGGNREPRISFSAYAGVSNVAKTYDVLNVAQYKDLMDEMGIINLPDGLKDETDWFKETYTTGVTQNYQLSYSGGNERTNYYVGGGYTKEDGVLPVSYSKRYNFRANMDTQVRKWINFSTNINYSSYKSNGIISGQGANRAGVVASVISTPTYAKVWDQDNPEWYWTNFYGANLTNPIENMGRTEHNYEATDRLIGTIAATLNLAEGLTFKSSVSMDRRWVHSFEFLDPVRTSYGRTQKGSVTDKRSDDLRMVYDNILTFDRSFGKHNLQVMGGTSGTTSRWENLSGTRTHLSSDYNNALIGLNAGNKGGLRGQEAGASEWAIMSYLGRISYNYESKYLLTVNFRSDGSSKLAPKHRWGYFPSFSAAWRISSESFMKDIEWIDDLKLRAGWGQTGNQSGLNEYAYVQMYNTVYYDWTDVENDYADSTPTIGSKSNLKNQALTWETNTQTNIGIDFTVLNNRLTLGVDAYYKRTTDMLMNVLLPAPNPPIIRNEGKMSNKGLEFLVSSRNFVGKGFNWDTDFNISINRNKLERLDLQQTYYYGGTSDMIGSNSIRMVPGEPLSKFWGYIADGVDPETGLIIYRDLDGNGEINASDKTWIGDANPKFTFGMTNNFSYKGWNLNVLINGSYGNDIFNATKVEMIGMGTTSNQTTEVLRRWRVPGQITDVPKSNESYNNMMSSRWIENGSYLKVKNITLSYDVKARKLQEWKISRLQPYVTLQNFITWTKYSGYDPEVSQHNQAYQMGIDWGTYPNVKTVVFGVNIDF